MTSSNKQISVARRTGIFLSLCFGLSWSAAFLAPLLLRKHRDVAAQISLTLMMAGPGLAGILCVFFFERGRRLAALGLRVRANWWWLVTYVTGITYSAIALGADVLIGGAAFVAPRSEAQFALSWLMINPAVQIVLATLMEELGWRGYLYELWRRFGFWRYSLASGLVWGLWHAPGIILVKLNYPAHPWLGAAAFVPYCMLFAPLVTYLRDKSRSVIAAGILHGAANSTELAAATMEKSSSSMWQGDTGVGGLIALGVSLLFVVLVQGRERENRAASFSVHPDE